MDRRELTKTVLLAQSSDRAALRELFDQVEEQLRVRVLSIVGDTDASEDVLQEVFILIWRKLAHLREPAHFRAWALRIATRAAVRHLNRLQSERERRASPELLEELRSGAERVIALQAAEGVGMVQLVRSLPPRSRSVLLLHYVDGLTLTEVSEVLTIPLGTAKSRLAYGLRAMRRLVQAQNADAQSQELKK